MSQQTNSITNNQKLAPAPATPSPFCTPPSSSVDMRMCTIAPSPRMPAFAYETPEEYQVRKRQKHNRIGRKYRSKLSDNFEGLQAILVQTAFLNLGVAAPGDTSHVLDGDGDAVLSPALSPEEVLELIRKRQEEEEQDDEDEDEEDNKMSPSGSSSSAAKRPRIRRSKTINKAGILAIARKTVVKFRAEVEALQRELGESDSE